jgi:hypothetical protein
MRGKFWLPDDSISPTISTAVIPAQAGIHLAFDFCSHVTKIKMDPGFRRDDDFFFSVKT